jgi:surfactin synthase thioesterase subunit
VVHLAGVCLGALVALEVARLENHQDKLALYAPPLFLDGWSLPRLTWLRPGLHPARHGTPHAHSGSRTVRHQEPAHPQADPAAF